MPPRTTIGVSLKMYFGHRQAREWFARVAARLGKHEALTSGAVSLFVLPTYLQIPAAVEAFAGTPILVGAQDVAVADVGAYTGEVSAAELAETGAALAEIGHAERRQFFGESDDVVAGKTAAALRNGLVPVLCVGESTQLSTVDAATAATAQLQAALGPTGGAVIVAYEPIWAIGAPEPAPVEHIATVTRSLRDALNASPGITSSAVIYGGSAGPGLLTQLGDAADGLFLGRFAHDPDALAAVIDEAAAR